MIHCSELMFGNWLYLEFKGMEKDVTCYKLCRVTGFEGSKIIVETHITKDGKEVLTNMHVDESMLKAITLTPEILKSNGFKIADSFFYFYRYDTGDGHYVISLGDMLDGLWDMKVVSVNKSMEQKFSYELENSFLKVHTLQNILDVCDIKKEIKLW